MYDNINTYDNNMIKPLNYQVCCIYLSMFPWNSKNKFKNFLKIRTKHCNQITFTSKNTPKCNHSIYNYMLLIVICN
jgi:hypothetical protein